MKEIVRNPVRVLAALVAAFGLGATAGAQAQSGPIKIGFLLPITGPLATPGKDMLDGFNLFWEQAKHTTGGRKVEIVVADTACNPDLALTQARRVVHQEKVHFMVGPLCGHEGPAVAQVSKETGVPLVMDTAGADAVTKWDRTPTVVRTAVSASQIGHPWGEYMYKELGLRNVTFTGQDYTWGHEVTLGAVRTFTALGGKVAKIIWNPIGAKDYGPTIAGIPADSRSTTSWTPNWARPFPTACTTSARTKAGSAWASITTPRASPSRSSGAGGRRWAASAIAMRASC